MNTFNPGSITTLIRDQIDPAVARMERTPEFQHLIDNINAYSQEWLGTLTDGQTAVYLEMESLRIQCEELRLHAAYHVGFANGFVSRAAVLG